ncbi:MAG: DUF3566 domain-containing protein [Acidimicrobiia bacterium]|nr:DUF3566 domain-containing protein [Acidimicrobiia bacterium]MDH5503171.1 DUF3566 domain-containing protein [Acidimicrobiia bacterium]
MAQVRRVRRIIRKIDPWTVLKVSFALYAVMGLALVLGGIIFWSFVTAAGYPTFIEDSLASIGLRDASAGPLVPTNDYMFRLAAFLGVAFTVLMTGITTLGAVMYNLISDVVGGLEVVVLEESFNAPVTAANRPVRQVQSWQTAPSTSETIAATPAETATKAPAPTGR